MANNYDTTTKFKVDISELKKAMQDAKRQIQVANSEFKAVSSSMDDWSKSTDGISAKLNQLDANLNSQKTILSNLERQYELTVQQMGEGSAEADRLKIAINNQQAAINKTEREISNYTQQLETLQQETENAEQDLEDLSDSLEDTGDSAEIASNGFTIMKGALASLVADGIRVAIGAFKDLMTDSANAFAQFSASTGIATSAMGEYEEAIQSVYKNNFGESLEDVANKMAKVKEVTGELDASKLQDMTEKAITLEDVFGMDMTETLRGVQSLVTHFGMSSEEAFDYLASGAQNGLNYTDELGDNISEYAGKFAEAGYSAEEYFQLLQNGSDGGAYNLDKVNDAINEVTARLADGTIGDSLDMFSSGTQDIFTAWQNGEATQKQVIDSIVKDIQNTTNEQEKMNLAAKAFGTMAEDGGTKFIESLSAVGNTYDDVTGKAEELADVKYDTPMAAIQGIGRTLKVDLLQPMVNSLMPHLNNLADWIAENLPAFKEKLKEIVDKVNEFLPLIVGLGTALAGLALAGLIQNLGAIGTAIKTAITSTQLWTAAQWLLNAALNANVFTLVAIAIAGLVAGFIVLWNKSEGFREFWIGLWEGIQSACGVAVEAIKTFFTETIPNAFNAVVDWVKTNWQLLLTFLINPFAGLFKYFYDNNDKFKEFVDNAIKQIKELPSKVWTWLQNTIDKIISFVSDMKSKATEAGKGFYENLVKAVSDLPAKFVEIGSSIVDGIWEGISSGWSWLTEQVSKLATSLLEGAKKLLKINSPSKVFADEVGKWIPAGIAVGVDKNAKTALNSIKNLTTDMVGATSQSLGVDTGGITGGVINNFYQTNNSPKALSRLEIYRQSKNLLGYAGGV